MRLKYFYIPVARRLALICSSKFDGAMDDDFLLSITNALGAFAVDATRDPLRADGYGLIVFVIDGFWDNVSRPIKLFCRRMACFSRSSMTISFLIRSSISGTTAHWTSVAVTRAKIVDAIIGNRLLVPYQYC